jgi:hypothetical protein
MAVAHRLHGDAWSAWLDAAWESGNPIRRDELITALRAVDPTPVSTWSDPLSLIEPMDETVTSAMYWQPPHDEDIVLDDPEVIAALRPIADALTDAPATAWWHTSLDLSLLRYTSRTTDEPPTPPSLTGAHGELTRWRAKAVEDEARWAANAPVDPAANVSGAWWSTPVFTSLPTTTRALPGLGSIQLAWEEDSSGQPHGSIWSLEPTTAPAVWEIDGPPAWTRLVERYPLDVTYSRRHDWYRTTGRDGRWLIPDWAAVAADYDAVHVSVAGYLTTATRALVLNDATAATVLAGWSPDQTWWLTDTLKLPSPHPQQWTVDADSGRWHVEPRDRSGQPGA